ncbi:hypothetical protein [Bacteriovorax sp. DB6_IX]|uniref:hypothetical protein n=1 Tax=Bacteriovorax sp. DB6_IX TaxID=1353530 RepID=UPI00038A1DCC|nr:hypothetical protein [Bacteriovorax sp. DB6_IX]EQC52480.1 hypothetical protein M901_1286 [Bacteriovorax sp. DB6_IX]
MDKLFSVLDTAMDKYSSQDHLENILAAKEEYFELTGNLSDVDEDYESRMNGFNYWYLTQRGSEQGETLIQSFLGQEELSDDLKEAILNINHSLFEYKGLSFTKKHTFKDILHDKKFHIPRDKFHLQLIKDDIFIARTIEVENEVFLLNDISVLPQDIRSILVKESKKVRKLQDKNRDLQFLMAVEKLKTKWRRYGHIDPKKIFKFDF